LLLKAANGVLYQCRVLRHLLVVKEIQRQIGRLFSCRPANRYRVMSMRHLPADFKMRGISVSHQWLSHHLWVPIQC